MSFNSFDEVKQLFEIDVFELIDEAFKTQSVQKTMIEFNQGQLLSGQDALGKTINTIGGSPYRAYTVVIRKSKGLPTNVVTLKDTGDFYKTFKVVIVSGGYEITADFEKPDGSILDNFSSSFDFLGLDQSSLTELIMEHVYPLISISLRKRLGL